MIGNKRIIVSMTSYPGRIKNVGMSIFSLLKKQTLPPDEIHLWLATPQFPNKENDLPEDLTCILSHDKVFLHWLDEDTKVHKRHEYFKIAKENDCVFLIDDDVFYSNNLIENVMSSHKKFPNCIICYNKYQEHIYSGRRILYTKIIDESAPRINGARWCGQSMIPASVYPKEILSDEHQKVRNATSPISDECWFQPWTVFYDIPILHLNYGWGIDISKDSGKSSGLVGWSHKKDSNGYEYRDNWLYAVLKAYPDILKKYKKLFNYGK